jgi:hypothetical protein
MDGLSFFWIKNHHHFGPFHYEKNYGYLLIKKPFVSSNGFLKLKNMD